jgi:hypothetical protein
VYAVAMRRLLLLLLIVGGPVFAQTAAAPVPDADPLAAYKFLLGTWSVSTGAVGSAGAKVSGTSTFKMDLGGHAIERTGSLDSCKGPQGFDCEHHDRLTIFADPNGLGSAHHATVFAFYLDNEGHVIYYVASMPDAHTVVFDSQGAATAPKFRLSYHLEGVGPKAVLRGKFQFAAPGTDVYRSYLEWSGTKQ